MGGTGSKSGREDAPGRAFDYDLGLECVPFLLAGVETRLCFAFWSLKGHFSGIQKHQSGLERG